MFYFISRRYYLYIDQSEKYIPTQDLIKVFILFIQLVDPVHFVAR